MSTDLPENAEFSGRFEVAGDAAELAEALSGLFVELEVRVDDPGVPASATIDTNLFGEFEFLRTRLHHGQFTAVRSELLAERSRYNHFFVACVLDGALEVSQQGRRIELHASDIALIDSSLGYGVHVYGPHDVLWIRVPRYRLEGRLPLPGEVTAQRVDGSVGTGKLASSLLRATLEEAPLISHAQAMRIANTLLDLLALCLELPRGPVSSRSDLVLRRIQNYIESNLGDGDLCLERIAERQGISARYLNKLFAREGSSAARWIRMRRLERCRQDIESPDFVHRSISDIAFSHGFNDTSTFNRAFKAHFGMTPRSLRAKT